MQRTALQSIMALLRRLLSARPPRRLEPFRPSELGPASETCRYWVYTRDFDQEVNALELLSDEACSHFQEKISDHFQRSKIASCIDEGLLRRKIAAAGCENVAVQILVDNSNSTNAETFAKIASSCLRLVEVLDEIGVETEVLGYTTVEWRGGKSRELWISEGRPPLPGRLNDLRHIVYKSFDEDSKDLLRSISRMGVIGVPKENIDGEALLWAAGRLFSHRAEKRILIAINDAAPVDDSTILANDENLLREHFRAAAGQLSAHEGLILLCVGLHKSVARYFKNSKWTDDAEGVFPVAVSSLVEVL